MNFKSSATLPIYGPPLRVRMYVADDIVDLVKKIYHEYEPGDEDCDGMNILNWPIAYLLFNYVGLTHNTIGHETDQLVHKVMREVGMKESQDSEEAYSYLTGWLSQWVYDSLRKAKISVE